MQDNQKKEAETTEREPEGREKDEVHEDHKKKKKKDEIIEALQKSLEEKELAAKALHEKMLYFQAEFENFKKQKAKEKEETLKFGNEVLVKELIPVVDNLEMALDHASKTEDYKGIQEGVQITLNQFLKVLGKAGIARVEALGRKFDPNLHEAFYQEEREDIEPGTVVSELQKGYLLNGRLVRPSRVSVSIKPEVQ
jgi:molecular chaperone GrpE